MRSNGRRFACGAASINRVFRLCSSRNRETGLHGALTLSVCLLLFIHCMEWWNIGMMGRKKTGNLQRDQLCEWGTARNVEKGKSLSVEFIKSVLLFILGVCEEPVHQVDKIATSTGVMRIISPTDCVNDRLAWHCHGNDTECLEQVVLAAQDNDIDMEEVKRWSFAEGKGPLFERIKHRFASRN
jgi:hypothetical protein